MQNKSKQELEFELFLLFELLKWHSNRPEPDLKHIDDILDAINEIKEFIKQKKED